MLILLLVIIGINIVYTSESNLIYAGMAKETAHQLGTPISSLLGWIDLLKDKGLWVTGVETGQDLYCQNLDFNSPSALVFGNEESGLRKLIRENCDFLVSVPTPGAISSLNVSVAAGVVLYEVTRQRLEKT